MNKFFEWLGGIAIIGAVAFGISSCMSSEPTEPTGPDCSSAGMAKLMAQTFVKRGLIAPSTASFGQSKVIDSNEADCSYRVVGELDSHNAFGAMIRSYYDVTLRYDQYGEVWYRVAP